MKLSEMIEIRDNRENLQGFLHYSEQIALQNLLNIEQMSKLSFVQCCNRVLFAYKEKKISNKTASKCFEILDNSNKEFKIELYRYDSAFKTLYKYSKQHGAYLYYSKCSTQEYNVLVKRDGRFI